MAKGRNGTAKPARVDERGHRMMKRYRLPGYCDVHEVVMRELDGVDEIEAAVWADKHRSSSLDSAMAAIQADQRESIRLSIVEVDGEPVNVGGMPYMDMDRWSYRTMRYIQQFFLDLNGVDVGEVKNAVAAGEIVQSPPSRMLEDDGDQPIAG